MKKYFVADDHIRNEPPVMAGDWDVYYVASDVDTELSHAASAVEAKYVEVVGLKERVAELESDLANQQAALREAVGYFNAEKQRSEELEKALQLAQNEVSDLRAFIDGIKPHIKAAAKMFGLTS